MMISLRVLLTASLFILASNAQALRGRPVSDLRFEDRADARATHAASDGADFLLLELAYERGTYTTFAQRIVDGHAVEPHRQIGRGEPAGLVWTGAHYLAAWQTRDGLFVAPVSRAGSPLAVPTKPVVKGNEALLTADGVSAMAFGYTQNELIAQPLDLSGKPSGPARSHTPPAAHSSLVAAAVPGGFAVVFSRYRGTWVMLFRADGTAITPRAVLLDGPYGTSTTEYHSNGAVIATDGTRILIVFGAGVWKGNGELKSVRLSVTGAIESTRVIDVRSGVGPEGLIPVGLVWDGSQYVLAANVEMDPATYARNFAVGLFRLTSTGERSGDPAWVLDATRPLQFASSFTWNDREFLVATNIGAVVVDQPMQAAPPVEIGRTVAAQQGLVIEARHDGYLAAWFETREAELTVRASRIDAAGNYLDGEGIVLSTMPARPVNWRIKIDGSGPHWFVTWSDRSKAWGRKILSSGVAAGAEPVTIGYANEIDTLWDGSHYVVLRIGSDGDLIIDRMTDDGIVVETRTLVESRFDESNRPFTYLMYGQPVLVKLGQRVMAIFLQMEQRCSPPAPCVEDVTVMAHQLDTNMPLALTEAEWGSFQVAANSDGSSALLMWTTSQRTLGAFLSAESPEVPGAPFLIESDGINRHFSSVTFDGIDYIAASSRFQLTNGILTSNLSMCRISKAGTVLEETFMPFESDESASRPEVAASATLPVLMAFTQQHPAYDDVPRGALLFASELDEVVTEAPTPVPVCATRNDDQTISVRWQPVADADGISLELQLFDGTWRPIAVAPGGSTSARVTLPGLEGSAIRLRSWNGGALSAPSVTASASLTPAATLRSVLRTCAGVPINIDYTLTGVAPFTVRWSDGLVQTNLTSSATRVATVSWDATLRIVSVADGSCGTNEIPQAIRLLVDDRPAITSQTRDVTIPAGQTATLNVKAAGDLTFTWFEGNPDDTSRRVGKDSRSFTTPVLYQSTRYWVRVSNRCGDVVDSGPMNITVTGPGKTRSVRR